MLQLSLSQLFISIGGSVILSLIGLVIYLSKALITKEKKTMDDKVSNLEIAINNKNKKFQEELDKINQKINNIEGSVSSILGLLNERRKKTNHNARGYLQIIKTLKDIGGEELFKDKVFMTDLVEQLSKRQNENQD